VTGVWALVAALRTIRQSVIKLNLINILDMVFSNSLRQAKFGKYVRRA